MPRNSDTPRRSSTKEGVNNFCFIDGSKSVPPATIFTSSACFASKVMASSSVFGLSNWKVGKLTPHLSQLRLVLLDRRDAAPGPYRETTATPRVHGISSVASGQPPP